MLSVLVCLSWRTCVGPFPQRFACIGRSRSRAENNQTTFLGLLSFLANALQTVADHAWQCLLCVMDQVLVLATAAAESVHNSWQRVMLGFAIVVPVLLLHLERARVAALPVLQTAYHQLLVNCISPLLRSSGAILSQVWRLLSLCISCLAGCMERIVTLAENLWDSSIQGIQRMIVRLANVTCEVVKCVSDLVKASIIWLWDQSQPVRTAMAAAASWAVDVLWCAASATWHVLHSVASDMWRALQFIAWSNRQGLCWLFNIIFHFLKTVWMVGYNAIFRPQCGVCKRGCAKLRTMCFTCVCDHLVPCGTDCGRGVVQDPVSLLHLLH